MSPDQRPKQRTEIHDEAHALTLFRALRNGEGRAYTAVTFPRGPRQGCERTIRMARAVGWVTEWDETPPERAYGVLDVLNEAGDIIQDFPVTTARGFQQIKRRLDLRVENLETP